MYKIHLPKLKLPQPDNLQFKPPTAKIPAYQPIVIPPSDLEAPEDVKQETTEQPEAPKLQIPVIDIQMPLPEPAVVITAVTTAVVAVATTSITSSLFEPIKKKVQKQLQAKVNKWKEKQKQKKKDSLVS